MKIALIDDQADMLEKLFLTMNKELPLADYYTFSSGDEFLKSWKTGLYDLIIIDVFMPGSLGIEVAHKIRETDVDVRLVFCTTSNEFASESYEVAANYYLHKPISEKSIQRMLKMIRLDYYEANRFLQLPDGKRVVLRDIIYTEYYNHTIIIHCKRGEDIQTRMSQTDWEALLSEHKFFYGCSKGIVVNFYEISKQENGLFLMSDGSMAPISRRKTKDALEAYASFRFEQLRKG